MFDSLLTNVFGRPKSKSGRNSQTDPPSGSLDPSPSSSGSIMTGPFSTSYPQMPQPPNSLYPASPYPMSNPHDQSTAQNYPSLLPFSQPPSLPASYAASQPYNYPTGTLAAQATPLDSVPFEAKLTLNNSTSLVSLDQLFKDIKKAGEVVDRADAYLRSNQSDYDFRTEQNLIHQ